MKEHRCLKFSPISFQIDNFFRRPTKHRIYCSQDSFFFNEWNLFRHHLCTNLSIRAAQFYSLKCPISDIKRTATPFSPQHYESSVRNKQPFVQVCIIFRIIFLISLTMEILSQILSIIIPANIILQII